MAPKIRAHASPGDAPQEQRGGTAGVLGVRREDKNKWERRVPVTPQHVKDLVTQGLKVIVQPSTRRIFTDEEYIKAGAHLQEDLTECGTIVAVKEVPNKLLLPQRNYVFFSHTIKGQAGNMPLLDTLLQKKVRLFDYECITKTGKRGGPRLVAFGNYAGYAGAIDCLRGMGERLLSLGFMTPLLHIGAAFMYKSLEEAKRAVSIAGEAIRDNGLPHAVCPFTVVFTGKGNVSQGALDIFKLLPHEFISPEQLQRLTGETGTVDNHKLYLVIAEAQHMVKRSDGRSFVKEQYYAEPDMHESIFQDAILPHCTAVVNGMYWDPRFPPLFTQEDLVRHVRRGEDKLLVVCDITCDENGSVPTKQFTSIEEPYYVYNALTDTVHKSMDAPGVLFHAVDHLPSELPREASQHFGNNLMPFLPALVATLAPGAPDGSAAATLPKELSGAAITEGGQLTREFQYIDSLRTAMQQTAADPVVAPGTSQVHAHGAAPPAVARLDLVGHLFDTKLINEVTDLVERARARLQILNLEVGNTSAEATSVSLLIMGHSPAHVEEVVAGIAKAASAVKAEMRRFGGDGSPQPSLAYGGPKRQVLLLGSGSVTGPLVAYLLRRPENVLVVASMAKDEVEAMARRFGPRVTPEIHNIADAGAGALAERERFVRESDVVVSLLPAPLHVGVARLAVKLGKHMVTASYVSPEMQALHQEASKAGVVIINEVGLDPGIDHMSAMKMIDEARKQGGKVLSFSSLCGGLPAPEAAGSSPIGYKFSWSPAGVVRASQNPSLWKQEGKLHKVPGSELLAHSYPLTMNNAFTFEVLPNRDCTAFAELYGCADAPTFFRGTLRYQGFCQRMLCLAKLGLIDAGPKQSASGAKSLRAWTAQILGMADADQKKLHDAAAKRLGKDGGLGVEFMAWLGLFSDAPLPEGADAQSPLEVISRLLQREENQYAPGERDMVAMQHELVVQEASGKVMKHTSTLIEYGEPKGDTAMAKTVGITAAMAAQLVLDDPKRFGPGVQRPLLAEWYEPMLALLEEENIRMAEKSELFAPPAKL